MRHLKFKISPSVRVTDTCGESKISSLLSTKPCGDEIATKNIDTIIQGDETPRTRTIVQKGSINGGKDLPVEYDDESMSQSVSHSIVSSVDDITVDKASPSPSAHMDFFEDL